MELRLRITLIYHVTANNLIKFMMNNEIQVIS